MKAISGSLLCLLMAASVSAGELHIAVASNFVVPMKEIVAAFERRYDHSVTLSTGSSGKFYAQIRHGGPYELFFSADQHKPEALEQTDLAVKGSRFTYAEGKLILWSANPGLIDGSPDILFSDNYHRLALANPRLAPYGAAATEVLRSLSLIETTQDKWVRGENIAQTFQFVRSGNAELGFVALSQVCAQGRVASGSYWLPPATTYTAIRQDAILLKSGEHKVAAHSLINFMKSREAHAIIEAYGYQIPEPTKQ